MLVKSILSTWIQNIYSTPQIPPPDLDKHASDMADAYDAYAKDALAFYDEPLLSTGKTAFLAVMLTMKVLPSTLANYALIIESAVIAYWTTSSFALIPPPPTMSSCTSIVITPPVAGSIQPGLNSVLLASTGDAADLANKMATEIHNGTLTTTCTFTGPSVTPPFPIIVIPNQPIK